MLALEADADTRRRSLERSRDRLYRAHSKAATAALVAALARLNVSHLVAGMRLYGVASTGKHLRASWAATMLAAAIVADPRALSALEAVNAAAWRAASARGRAEAAASTDSGPPEPAAVAKAAKAVEDDADLTDRWAPDWVSRQLSRLAWQLSSDELVAHEDPEAAITRSIAAGDPITASTEDLMHHAYSRAFVDWFATGSGADLGQLALVTEQDAKVCAACDLAAAEGPYFASEVPEPPLHPSCRCHLERS